MSREQLYRIIELVCTAIVSIAGALLLKSCASTTTVVTRSKTGSGGVTSTVSVRTDAKQDLQIGVSDSLVKMRKIDSVSLVQGR